MKYNFKEVFAVFNDNYKEIPLEIFAPDPYRVLISTLLSSRTKDEVTYAASMRLFKKAPDMEKLKNLKPSEVEKIIYPVGFYKTKSKHLNKLACIVINRFKGIIPNKKFTLMKLPGVGTKTANLVLNRAFSSPAIAVDTHVHKIANLLGWVKTKSPETTEKELNKILPKIYWTEINKLFVSIGRQHPTDIKLRSFLKENKLIN